MKVTKKSLDYMTNYRGFAILMIVMVHCLTYFYNRNYEEYPYLYSFWGHSTDLFLFISGFLFEYLLYKKYSYKTFISKKIRRLIIPYLFWALPISIVYFVIKGFDIKFLIYTLFTGLGHANDAHWYIPFIFTLFVLSPLLTFLQSKKILYIILLPISLFVSLTSSRAVVNEWYPIAMIPNLLGFFILGMCFSHYREHIIDKIYKFDWLFILCGLAICFLSSFYEVESPKPVLESLVGYFSGNIKINLYALNKLFYCIGFLCLFYRLDLKGSRFPLLEKLAHYSFGIYFCHLYVIRVVSSMTTKCFNYSNGGSIFLLLCFLLVLTLSVIIIFLFRKIKFTKNIVGV